MESIDAADICGLTGRLHRQRVAAQTSNPALAGFKQRDFWTAAALGCASPLCGTEPALSLPKGTPACASSLDRSGVPRARRFCVRWGGAALDCEYFAANKIRNYLITAISQTNKIIRLSLPWQRRAAFTCWGE